MDAALRSSRTAGAEVVRQAFGGHLTQQGRGFYVTLELFAIAWGTSVGSLDEILPGVDHGERLRYVRRGHDFARRWMADEDLTDDDRENVQGDGAEETLRSLLVSLRVPVPHRRVVPKWGWQHLYPYIGELVHYDAVQRRGSPSIERNAFRGGGALAHRILRSDGDLERLADNRSGLQELISEEGSALGQLVAALAVHDRAPEPATEFEDEAENDALVHDSPWVELLRSGTRNITRRAGVPRAKKVELLMHWIPFCIARHQLALALRLTGREPEPLVISVDPSVMKIRQQGRRSLERARAAIEEALLQEALRLEEETEGEARGVLADLRTGSRRWCEGASSFFTGTLAAVGALNAHAGRRHFTLSLSMLEAAVHASLAEHEQLPFDQFCSERLLGQLNLVTDERSGAAAGLTTQIDAGDLARNGAFLASELKGLGLIHEYSDATRLVHAETTR